MVGRKQWGGGVRIAGVSIHPGTLLPGPNNAITDIGGVRVGYTTLVEGTDVRTGVTAIIPLDSDEALFAGVHRLNGNGEMTGWHFIRDMGMLTSPIAITNTHSVGVAHAALVAHSVRAPSMLRGFMPWSLPVVAETWDGLLNDINGFHVLPEHVEAAIRTATGGPVAQGNVGGGTGMICHGFKGGTGTASRVLPDGTGRYTVGVLVQANYGSRARLTIEGVPVGREIGPDVVPLPRSGDTDLGSIIVVVGTDAPLIPTQCDRLAQRAALGVARVGGTGADSSGDLFLAFATGNRVPPPTPGARTVPIQMVHNNAMSPLFEAVVDATEEAIVNALLAAETMTGFRGKTAYALPHDRLLEVMKRYGRDISASGAGSMK